MTYGDVLNALAASNLEAKSFDVLASVSSLAAAARNRANVLRIASSFYILNRTLANFLDEGHAIIAGKKSFPPPPEPIRPEAIRTTAENLEHIHRSIQYIGELMKRAQLTNNSLTAGSLKSLLRRADELLDFADWLETMSNPQQFESAFARARDEKDRGEIFDLRKV